jgi:hypothetical protein
MKYNALVKAIQTATAQFQGRAALAVNQALVLRNWLVGAWILEFEQHGQDRAKYGERLLKSLAKDLSISGLEIRNLQNCRLIYAAYPQIRQALSAEFPRIPISGDTVSRIPGTLTPQIAEITPIQQTVSAESPTPLPPETLLRLSWSHLQELIAIDDPRKRAFFENECLLANWSVRQLRRQIGSLLYRLLRLPLPRRPAIGGKTPPLPRSRPRTHRKPNGTSLRPQTCPAKIEILTRCHMTTNSNHRAGQSPIRDHSAKIISENAWQHDRIELLPLNPDYDPIPIAAHDGPEMVVVGDWVSSIE